MRNTLPSTAITITSRFQALPVSDYLIDPGLMVADGCLLLLVFSLNQRFHSLRPVLLPPSRPMLFCARWSHEPGARQNLR